MVFGVFILDGTKGIVVNVSKDAGQGAEIVGRWRDIVGSTNDCNDVVVVPPYICPSTIIEDVVYLGIVEDEKDVIIAQTYLERLSELCEVYLGQPVYDQLLKSNFVLLSQIVEVTLSGWIPCNTDINVITKLIPLESSRNAFKRLASHFKTEEHKEEKKKEKLDKAVKVLESQYPWRDDDVHHTRSKVVIDIVEYASGYTSNPFIRGCLNCVMKFAGTHEVICRLGTLKSTTDGSQILGIHINEAASMAAYKSEGIIKIVPPDVKFSLATFTGISHSVDLLEAKFDRSSGVLTMTMHEKITNCVVKVGAPYGCEVGMPSVEKGKGVTGSVQDGKSFGPSVTFLFQNETKNEIVKVSIRHNDRRSLVSIPCVPSVSVKGMTVGNASLTGITVSKVDVEGYPKIEKRARSVVFYDDISVECDIE